MPQTIEQMDAVTLIINDHRIVDQLFTQFEQATDAEMKLGLVAKIIEELSVHADVEERELYPAIAQRLENGEELREHALEEHEEAKQVLAELERLPVDDPQFDSKVHELIEEVRHHVEEEESTHLAQLREAMSSEELVELGARIREAKNNAPVRPMPGGRTIDLDDASRDELYAKAQELGIEGRSDMTKEELARAVGKAQ
jgi:hemerythrin superfamily protein